MAESDRDDTPTGALFTILDGVPPTPPEQLAEMEANRAAQRHFAAIGGIAASWSYFEAVIDTETLALADVASGIGTCFTAQIAGSRRKLDAYIALARLLRKLPDKLISDLEKFASDTASIAERRNRTVHDAWYFNHPEPPERLEASARKILRLMYVPTTTQQLHDLWREIAKHREAFEDLAKAVATAPPPSPDRPPESSAR